MMFVTIDNKLNFEKIELEQRVTFYYLGQDH